MGAYDHWLAQKPNLCEILSNCEETGSAAYAVRHVLTQVEHNTMAGQGDDLLRQQTGILFGCCKTATGLLDVTVATEVWALQSLQTKKSDGSAMYLWIIAGLAQLAAAFYGYAKGHPLTLALMAVALVAAVMALWRQGRKRKNDPLKITAKPSIDKLFHVMDMQMQAIDRYIDDFAQLNEQAEDRHGTPDGKTVALMADMLEALYQQGEEPGGESVEGSGVLFHASLEDATRRMLAGLGLDAIPYSQEAQSLFTILPSKTETRTLVPAILAAADDRLLRRGTAAVQMAVDGE